MNENVKILVACHKPDVYPTDDLYLPVHVGKALSELDLGIQTDNEGVNISAKNPYYCELTAIYWAWKNLKNMDMIGLCHYRRYFDFHNQCRPIFASSAFSSDEFKSLNLSLDTFTLTKVLNGAIVVAKPDVMNCTIRQNYCEYHISDDLNVLENIIGQTQENKFIEAYDAVVNRGYKLYPYNMFVMSWKDFDAYCNWLFPILSQVERAIDISSYTAYQKRIYGFMAERLFNVWLRANNKQIIEKPVMFITDAEHPNRHVGPRKVFREILRIWRCKRINKLYNKARS